MCPEPPMKKPIALLCLLVGLHGCGAQSGKQQHRPQNSDTPSAEEQSRIADAAVERWQESEQVADLEIALFHYADLHRRHPDNVLWQRSYYQTLFWQVASKHQRPTAELEALFSQLNPLVREELSPPSTIIYLAAITRKAPPQQLIPLLQQMVKDQPSSPYAWGRLAVLYTQVRQPWLSLAAAQRANALDPENADYWFLMGRNLQRIAAAEGCLYSESAYNKKSATYFAKAAVKDKSVRNLSASASAYLDLGLFPLAYSEAKKAYETSAEPISRYYYAQAAEYMQMPGETARLAHEMLRGEPDPSAHEILARLSAREKQWDQAASHMRQFVKSNEKDLLAGLRLQWLEQLTGQAGSASPPDTSWPTWYKTVFTFISDTQRQPAGFDPNFLTDRAKTPCEVTEAHFYTAYAHWLRKDRPRALQHLQLTVQSEAKGYTEYLWALVFASTL